MQLYDDEINEMEQKISEENAKLQKEIDEINKDIPPNTYQYRWGCTQEVVAEPWDKYEKMEFLKNKILETQHYHLYMYVETSFVAFPHKINHFWVEEKETQ